MLSEDTLKVTWNALQSVEKITCTSLFCIFSTYSFDNPDISTESKGLLPPLVAEFVFTSFAAMFA